MNNRKRHDQKYQGYQVTPVALKPPPPPIKKIAAKKSRIFSWLYRNHKRPTTLHSVEVSTVVCLSLLLTYSELPYSSIIDRTLPYTSMCSSPYFYINTYFNPLLISYQSKTSLWKETDNSIPVIVYKCVLKLELCLILMYPLSSRSCYI